MNKKVGAGFLVIEGMLSTSLTLPIEMLRAAESAASIKDKNSIKLSLVSVSDSESPLNTQSGFDFKADFLLNEISHIQWVIVPALWRNPTKAIKKHAKVIQWLKELNDKGCIIIGVGTGCCFMAEAGLLDGKPATTHWHYFDQFQKRYPRVDLKRQYFITQSNNLYCAASVNAVADLTVHFIHRLYGAEIANHVQRNFSHEIRKDFESTSFYDDKHRYHPDEDIVQVQIWLQDNCHKTINLKEVAEYFEMSPRNFNRRFKKACDQTPLQYLQSVRMDVAKDLLQTSNYTISEIAERVGYSDISHFAVIFKRLLKTTPSEYRSTVRSKLFTAKH